MKFIMNQGGGVEFASSQQNQDILNIKENGDVLVKGIGGYDGTNPTGSISTLQTKVNAAQAVSNLVTAWQATPDNSHYPSEKLVYDSLPIAMTDAEIDIICV